MNGRPTKTSVGLAAGAASAFTVAALIEILPVVWRHDPHWARISTVGFAVTAVAWWAVCFQWKRKLER